MSSGLTAPTLAAKVAALSRADLYHDRPTAVEVIQTHFAFVFLTSGFPFLTLLFGLLLAGMIMALAVFSHFPKIADAALVQQKTGAKGAAQSSGAARNKRKGRK